MELDKIKFINDGQKVEKQFVEEWNIRDYCDTYDKKMTISFVGVVVYKEKILFSFPKHYSVGNLESNEKIECMKEILSLLSANKSKKYGSFDSDENDEFPLKAYIQVANYYRKFGLYKSTEKITQEGHNGRINWNKTINKANKIFQDNNILFYPFILNKVRDKDVFLGECMDFVLYDATKYKFFIDKVISYKSRFHNKIFNNINFVCNQLKQLKSSYFKDSEKKLIDSLIKYLIWKSISKEDMKLLTLKFENYWEDMMLVYLNGNFSYIRNNKIIWVENSKNNFVKKREYIESSKKIRELENYRKKEARYVEYDHITIKENIIYVFDSKYFNEVKEFNYKQAFYNYLLKSSYPNKTIINGLLLPTEKEYHINVHVDKMDLDSSLELLKLKIIEHYVNLRDVINYYNKMNLRT
ncbi:LlaJI family restriction endonuclease [Gemella morbillorum]|uniref:LlaJI family restriction endonuclease n=1 Tax=Gemella morbillorum TaxID=29391 RepID=UPI0028D5A045|nr:LlaJI family restriction endonuclease [Gemella morbillorum]